jgi:hypothetical protein
MTLAIKHDHLAMPIWDYWMTTMHLKDYEAGDFRVLWEQHNEHRVIFPEWMFAADYLFFQGREIFPLVLSLACHVTVSFFFVWTLFRTKQVPRLVAMGGTLLCLVVMGWQGLTYLLSAPFLLQWTMFELFAALAFWEVSLVRQPRWGRIHLALAIAFAAAAEFTSAQGLAIWPIVFVLAVWLRVDVWAKTSIALAGAGFTGLFFIGYHKMPDSHPGFFLLHLGYWAKFIGCYLGVPFTFISTDFGIAMGWLSLLLCCVLLWRLVQDDVRGERAGVFYGGFTLITLATAFLTSIGRMEVWDVTFRLTREPRYSLIPILYWSSLLMPSIWLVSRQRNGLFRAMAAMAGVAAFLAFFLPQTVPVAVARTDEFARFQVASLSMEVGLEDPWWIQNNIYPSAALTHTLDPVLRKERLSIYADSRFQWMDERLQESKKQRQAAPGGVRSTKRVPGGVEVEGWIDNSFGGAELVFLDDSDKIVGLGECPDAGLPRERQFPKPETASGWIGFVKDKSGMRAVHALILTPDRSQAYPVGGEIDLP